MKHLPLVLLGFSVAAFVGSGIALWRATDQDAPAAVPAVSEMTGEEVTFTGDVSRSSMQVNETLRFWVTVRNKTATTVRDIRLVTRDVPAYEFLWGCWCPPQGPSCLPQAVIAPASGQQGQRGAPDCEPLVSELAAGQRLAVWGDLRANAGHPPELLSLVARWSSVGPATSQVAVPLGRVEVRTNRAAWLLSIRQFGKDFGLPLTLAVLGFAFTVWEKWRDARQRAAEKEKEDRQRLAERQKEQLVQTWNTMLPVSHNLNTQFYIRLQWAANVLLKWGKRYRASPGDENALCRAFFGWALLRKHMRDLRENAGFYFKNRIGEELVNQCGAGAVREFDGKHDALKRLNAVISLIETKDGLGSFLEKMDKHPGPYKGCLGDFVEWAASQDFVFALKCLSGLSAVLEYEVNRPYEYWYGSREKLHLDDETKCHLLQLAADLEKDEPRRMGFVSDVTQYIAQGVGQ